MKLAVSNIAWPASADNEVAEALSGLGVTGIEVAPTMIWNAPLRADDSEIERVRRFWESRRLPIVAAQSLLFGQPELTLFESDAARSRTLDYLCRMIRVCGLLGAQAAVFGSPKNRRIGAAAPATVWQIAVEFFGRLADAAVSADTCVVVEANPLEYGADFLTRASEALDLVRAVGHKGLRLHLDSGCMTLAGDSPGLIGEAINEIRHFHVSEPGLAPIGTGGVPHREFANGLRESRYREWLSVEMRQTEPFRIETMVDAVLRAREAYLDV